MSLLQFAQKLSPHRGPDGRFYNQPGERFHNVLGHTAIMFLHLLRDYKKRRPQSRDKWIEPSIVPAVSEELNITWVGHSTFLIQVNGINILTDPLFGSSSVLFPRILPPGIALNQLPKIDYIVLSHNHMDHMGGRNLRVIKEQSPDVKVLVPLGDKKWFDRRGFNHAHEYSWWDQYADAHATFTFLPAYHWSQRGLFDRNRSLWGSWMIQVAGTTIYFGGDTAHWHHFGLIGEAFPSIDLAFMPIGPCEPREWMEPSHISAGQAVDAFLELGARQFVPMHWGTFYFGEDTHEGPINRLQEGWSERADLLSDKQLHILKVGQQLQPTIQQATVASEQIITTV